jgi:hypothetical protein
MKRLLVCTISVAMLTAAAGLKWMATAQQRQGSVFIAGDRPVTEDQVRAKLQADGWANVQIQRDGKAFDASGTKYGKPISLAIDAETGRLRSDDDDDGEDGD